MIAFLWLLAAAPLAGQDAERKASAFAAWVVPAPANHLSNTENQSYMLAFVDSGASAKHADSQAIQLAPFRSDSTRKRERSPPALTMDGRTRAMERAVKDRVKLFQEVAGGESEPDRLC